MVLGGHRAPLHRPSRLLLPQRDASHAEAGHPTQHAGNTSGLWSWSVNLHCNKQSLQMLCLQVPPAPPRPLLTPARGQRRTRSWVLPTRLHVLLQVDKVDCDDKNNVIPSPPQFRVSQATCMTATAASASSVLMAATSLSGVMTHHISSHHHHIRLFLSQARPLAGPAPPTPLRTDLAPPAWTCASPTPAPSTPR